LKDTLRVPHLWIILAIMSFGAAVYYSEQIPVLHNIVTQAPIQLARYSTHRILSIIPVAYAALIFRFRGGVIATVFISLALLPRALIISPELEAIAEITAFLFIGLLVSWLIDRQRRAVHRLENAQKELSNSLQTIKNQQQQLASLHAISTVVYRTMDVNQIASDTLNTVLEATGAEAGWIYLRNEETGDLVLSAHRGLTPQFIADRQRIKPGEHLDGRVAQSRRPVVVKANSKEFNLGLAQPRKNSTILIAPLRARIGNQGTLGIVSSEQHSAEKLELLTALGKEIGITVGHARLNQKERDITQQLRLSEERYRGLFENSSEAIFVCSTTGRIISINEACEHLTGHTQQELAATNIYELFSGGDLEMVREMFSGRHRREMVGGTEEFRLMRKDGTEAFVQVKISPLLRGKQVIGLQAIAHDVTEERQLRQNMEHYITQITKAQEDERLRISRELHDDTAQVLAGLSRGLDSLLLSKKGLPKATIENLEKLHDMADSALEGVRRFSQDLRPSILDDLGLVPALEWLITDLEKQCEMVTHVTITGRQRHFPPEKELTVFRIAQEALSNVKRHSRATTVEMTIDFSDDALTLVVSDDGQGFSMPERASDLVLSAKLGVLGMRERARLIGGTLIVQSEVGAGTTVTLRIPQ